MSAAADPNQATHEILEPGVLAGTVDNRSSTAGLRAVATFEALKGAVVLLLGFTIWLMHSNLEDYAENLLYHLHIDFDRRFGHMLLDAATSVGAARRLTIGLAVGSYCSVRFIEAWGLWNRRVWAEWFALLSGALYLPWELIKYIEHPNWQHVLVIVVNLVIVGYMLYIRIRETRALAKLTPKTA